MTDLFAPPVPVDADLRHYPDMPLEVARLRDSGIALADAEVFRCAVLLWCASWHQVPAGSLADDDVELCSLVGLGRDLRTWRKVRNAALRGWHLFADGRLYHPVVCEKVIAGLNSTANYEWGKACGRVRKENLRRRKARMDVLAMPEKPAELFLLWPVPVTEREPKVEVRVPEREFSPERKGMESFPQGVMDGRPEGTGNDSLQSAASAEGPDGPPARHDVRALVSRVVASMRMPT